MRDRHHATTPGKTSATPLGDFGGDPDTLVGLPAASLIDDGGFASRYEARATIGQGGMGEIKLCRDQRIGRDVAVKLLRAGTGSVPDNQLRFFREARVQGQLEHPSIVPVYDLGNDPGGTPFFTMKRVRGLTLGDVIDLLREGEPAAMQQYTRRKLLTAFLSVCMAVDYAHSRGVLHRDLKPGNVMLGDFGEVYVLDWGLAKITGADDNLLVDSGAPASPADPRDSAPRTQLGAVMGTPGFMAPEQIRGEIDRLDARTDVYALGAILFELLALEPLHSRDGTPDEAVASTLAGVDGRPSLRGRDVPPELDAICHKATRLDPAERYASARELSSAIERFLDGDRDLAMRRGLADAQLESAASATTRALTEGDPAARKEALRAVGRVLALDPDNVPAARTLVRLLTEPPRELPADARAEFDQEAERTSAHGARTATIAYLSFFLYFPLTIAMGIRSWLMSGIVGGAWIVAAIAAWTVSRRPHRAGGISWRMAIASFVAVGMASCLFGPLLFLPSLAAVNTLAFMMAPRKDGRWLAIALGCLAIVLPFALDATGVTPPAYRFDAGVLCALPRTLAFPPLATTTFLLLTSVGLVITSALLIARFRDTLTEAQQRLSMTAWQLRQIVPADAVSERPQRAMSS